MQAEHVLTIPIMTPVDQLPLRIRPRAPLSDDELFEFCRINRDLRIERTKEGELIIMTPTGGETGRQNFWLIVEFGAWVKRDGTGVGFDSSTGFVLPNGAERSPDVAWVRKDRWERLTEAQRTKFAPLCPDFVIELRSPTDRLNDVQAKMAEYIDNGAAMGWLIDPIEGRVHVYRPNATVEVIAKPASISGDPVMAGLVLDLREIW